MIEGADPTKWGVGTWLLAFGMSFAGGILSRLAKIRAGHARAFNFAETTIELTVSGIVGLLAFMAADGMGQPPSLCAVAAGIGGNMGIRLTQLAERWITKRFG